MFCSVVKYPVGFKKLFRSSNPICTSCRKVLDRKNGDRKSFFQQYKKPEFFSDRKPAFSINVSDCIRIGLILHEHKIRKTAELLKRPRTKIPSNKDTRTCTNISQQHQHDVPLSSNAPNECVWCFVTNGTTTGAMQYVAIRKAIELYQVQYTNIVLV